MVFTSEVEGEKPYKALISILLWSKDDPFMAIIQDFDQKLGTFTITGGSPVTCSSQSVGELIVVYDGA
ncbi:Hypothetical predicted protein [Octopus vulgaris]|uniref:Uncharacterized protein n=1 Tax=Octopus vulgaris TaxID=6645 RepID=A0AA36B0P3_OCTVU|nr:Hypothetical predicted protein [Octopus vulgaris]